jgi:hypothetical protein
VVLALDGGCGRPKNEFDINSDRDFVAENGRQPGHPKIAAIDVGIFGSGRASGPVPPVNYSCLNASMGSSRAARRAGR